MGGKVVMKFAQNNPHLVNKLIVADIAPRHYPVHHQHLLDVLLSINLNGIKRRQEVSELMERNIENKVIVLFLLKNLYNFVATYCVMVITIIYMASNTLYFAATILWKNFT